jgi:hypothetical protein
VITVRPSGSGIAVLDRGAQSFLQAIRPNRRRNYPTGFRQKRATRKIEFVKVLVVTEKNRVDGPE